MTAARRPRAALIALALLATGAPAAVSVPRPALAQAGASATATAGPKLEIPFGEFTLPNGLRVIVHTDRKAPIVAVNVWYHVGSKNEQPGRTGFAHLFEHLMFQGSENYKGEYFGPYELVGATDQNGTTNSDRTNYFQNVPTTALDLALWMESDRMGHFLGAIDQKLLDEQRGVVQNEKRQGENQPYGSRIDEKILEALYPVGHPYNASVIGSMADLNGATLDDVKTWFKSWYGPNNAVLVLAGDIDLATAQQKVTRFFGDIPASATLADLPTNIPKRSADTRDSVSDRVPQTRVYRAWPAAELGSADATSLELFAQVLGGSATSRLSRRLVHGDKIADDASAFLDAAEVAGTFYVVATAKSGVDAAKIEGIVGEELKRLLAEGPSAEELERAKVGYRAGFVRGIERIGGFGGKSDLLAACTVYSGKPDCSQDELTRVSEATPASVQAVAAKWLGVGSHTLVVTPGQTPASALPETVREVPKREPAAIPAVDPKYKTVETGVDRSTGVPKTTSFPSLKFPALKRAVLSNGMKVVLAERHETPVVELSIEFPGGFSADLGKKLGTAGFAMEMLDEGAGTYGALELAAREEALGARIRTGAGLDSATVSLSALSEKLPESLDVLADVLRRPRFDAAELERVRATWIAGIQQEKARPQGAALRVIPPLLYGAGHPYAIPQSGTGTEASIGSLTREDLLGFQQSWLQPDKARIVIAGDASLEQIVPLLEKRFGDWKTPEGAPTLPAPTQVALPGAVHLYLIDQPGATQSNVYVGQLIPPTGAPSTIDFDFANTVLGGVFTSRLNMNLREDKHWAYGANSRASNAVGQRPWLASAAVQTDKTADSVAELRKEITAFASGEKPASDAEIAKVRAANTLRLPGGYETAAAVLNLVATNLRYGRPDDFLTQLKTRSDAMTGAQVQTAAKTIAPGSLLYVVVGDLAKIEKPVRALELGETTRLDADGKPLAPVAPKSE